MQDEKELDNIERTGRVYLELSNSNKKFWVELAALGMDLTDYKGNPQKVGPAIINLYERFHTDPRTISDGKVLITPTKNNQRKMEGGGRIDLEKSCFLLLSYNRFGDFQLHQFPITLPDPNVYQWQYLETIDPHTYKMRSRIVAVDNTVNTPATVYEWYGESGGQLKCYPFASTAIWASEKFRLEPLPTDTEYGIKRKAILYYPELWARATGDPSVNIINSALDTIIGAESASDKN